MGILSFPSAPLEPLQVAGKMSLPRLVLVQQYRTPVVQQVGLASPDPWCTLPWGHIAPPPGRDECAGRPGSPSPAP